MKDAMNYFIPIVEDPMNDITGRCITVPHHNSSNGYYGYQPVAVGKEDVTIRPFQPNPSERMATNDMDMDIQFNNYIEPDAEETPKRTNFPQVNRKRTCEDDADLPDYKKRRENDPLLLIPDQPKCNQIRQPTHNIPDLPRCMMERNQQIKPIDHDIKLLEELLEQTHGGSLYHWQGHDL